MEVKLKEGVFKKNVLSDYVNGLFFNFLILYGNLNFINGKEIAILGMSNLLFRSIDSERTNNKDLHFRKE